MARALTTSPLRALHFIRANYPRDTFVAAFHFLLDRFWTPPNVDLTQDAELARVLAEATETLEGGRRLFSDEQVRAILDARESMKESVKNETGEAVKRGAFGAPWLWATNAQGKGEAFFGSDR